MEKAKVKYLVIGGLAVIFHGYPRATVDLDIMILLDDSNAKAFIEVAKKLGYRPRIPVKLEDFADAGKRKIWAETKNMKVFTLNNPKEELEQIDVAITYFADFDKAYARRKIVKIDGLSVPLASVDDIIEMKQTVGRSIDNSDILALKNIQKVNNGKKST